MISHVRIRIHCFRSSASGDVFACSGSHSEFGLLSPPTTSAERCRDSGDIPDREYPATKVVRRVCRRRIERQGYAVLYYRHMSMSGMRCPAEFALSSPPSECLPHSVHGYPDAYRTIQGISNSTKSKYSCSRRFWYSPPRSSVPPPDFAFALSGFARCPRYARCDCNVASVRFVVFDSGCGVKGIGLALGKTAWLRACRP